MSVTAYQVTTSSTTIAAPEKGDTNITIQNLGPDPIYIQVGSSAATVAGGLQIPAGAAYEMSAYQPVTAITTVLQVSPNDTRVSIERVK